MVPILELLFCSMWHICSKGLPLQCQEPATLTFRLAEQNSFLFLPIFPSSCCVYPLPPLVTVVEIMT